jgi:hypothetical protein
MIVESKGGLSEHNSHISNDGVEMIKITPDTSGRIKVTFPYNQENKPGIAVRSPLDV